jgi:hypothetical protein
MDFGLGIGAVILGIITMVYFLGLPGKAGYYPKLISGAIIILGIVIILNAVKAMKKSAPADPEQNASKKKISYPSVALIVLYLVIYYFAFHTISYTLSTFLLMTATSLTLGYRNWKVLIPTTALVSIGLYLAFTMVFNVRFMAMFF